MSQRTAIEKSSETTKPADTAPKASAETVTDVAARAQSVEVSDAGGADQEAVADVQLDGKSPATLQAKEVRKIAADGLSGPAQELPHLDQIQRAFGAGHDLSDVRAHVGGTAKEAAGAIGAQAYTSGDQVAFKGTPDLRTAAHEAAHVVQQRDGVQLSDGVGESGDIYEKHADKVADKVVRGESVESLLSDTTVGSTKKSVQLLGESLDEESSVKPAHGEDKGTQRRYTPEQYIEMWEKEQGRKMTEAEKKTIRRGCIGLTATNIAGGGNPLDSAEACWATFDEAHDEMIKKNKTLDWMAKIPFFGKMLAGEERYILFAKLFWSNQDPDPKKRKKSDPTAFIPDAKTGKVDMSEYKYKAQPGYVNFDYGWWDEASQCFWHANHMDYGDPKDPMIVLQSTQDKFAHKISHLGETRYGYIDFDRIIFCIALAKNYNPGLAAIASAQP